MKNIHFSCIIFILIHILSSYCLISQVPGTIDQSFGVNDSIGIKNLYAADIQIDNKVIIGGDLKILGMSSIARLDTDANLDPTFNVSNNINGRVTAIEIQDDGHVLVGGKFTRYGTIPRNGILRLTPNGSLDTTFNHTDGFNVESTTSTLVNHILELSDGKILVSGSFETYDGKEASRIIRLNSNGTIDSTFKSSGADREINKIIPYAGNRFIVAGTFDEFNGIPSGKISVINYDGTTDTTFVVGQGFNFGSNSLSDVAVQNDGKIIAVGMLKGYQDTRGFNNIARLNIDGSYDSTFFKGVGFDYNTVESVSILENSEILVCGQFYKYNGINKNGVVLIQPNGEINNNFDPGIANGVTPFILKQTDSKLVMAGNSQIYKGELLTNIFRVSQNLELDYSYYLNSGLNKQAKSMELLDDGRILLAGSFTHFDSHKVGHVAILNPQGNLDITFSSLTGFSNYNEYTNAEKAIQLSDGSILVGGKFNTYQGTFSKNIAKIDPNGKLDTLFNSGNGFSHRVVDLQELKDKRIIVAGDFNFYNGSRLNNIAILHSNGKVDSNFISPSSTVGYINGITISKNDKIYVFGSFSSYNGLQQKYLVRINTNGSVDDSFKLTGTGLNNTVHTVTELSDGSLLVGGKFLYFNGEYRSCLVKITATGKLDTSFKMNTGYLFDYIYSIKEQNDGKIVIGGHFYDATKTSFIDRLNSDGSSDSTFSIYGFGFNGSVNNLAIQRDGKIICSGDFTNYNDTVSNFIIRLNGGTSTISSLNQNETGTNIMVYPNPARKNFYVQLPSGINEGVISIIELNGIILERTEITSDKHLFNSENYSNGLKIIQVKTKQKTFIQKIIINN